MTLGLPEYQQPANIIGNVNLSAPTPSDGHTPTVGDYGSLSSAVNGNGTWDRWRNNADATLLASAARTATTLSPVQTNYNGKGVFIYLNVTVAGTGFLILRVTVTDPATGITFSIYASAHILAIGAFCVAVYPGVSGVVADVTDAIPYPLSRQWGARVQHSDASSWTYSLGSSQMI